MNRNKYEILITGATGLIGSNLVIKLAKLKYKKILLLDNFSSSRKEVLKKIKNTYKFYKINLTSKKKVEKVFKENNIKLIKKIIKAVFKLGIQIYINHPHPPTKVKGKVQQLCTQYSTFRPKIPSVCLVFCINPSSMPPHLPDLHPHHR